MPIIKRPRVLNAADPINRGRLAFWPMNDGAGLDLMPTRTRLLPGTAPSLVASRLGKVASFNGSTSHLIGANNLGNSANHAVFAWVRPNFSSASTSAYCIINRGNAGTTVFGMRIFFNTSTYGWYVDNVSGSGGGYHSTATSFSAGEWHCVGFTYSAGGTPQLYFDGNPIATSLTYGSWGNADLTGLPFYIGRERSGANPWNGEIGPISVFHRVPLRSEIRRLYRDPWAGTARRSVRPSAVAGYTLPLSAGSFTLTGQSVATQYGRRLPLANGSFSLSGQAVSLKFGRVLPLSAGSLALSGQAANLLFGRRLAADNGSITLTGQDVTFRRGLRLPLDQGAFSLSGQAAGLLVGRKLGLAHGSFSLTGQDVTMRRGRRMVIDAGTFAVSGQDLSLLVGRRITLSHGAFTLTGQVVDFIAAEAQPGGYLVIEVLSGTFQDGEVLTDTAGGSGQADGPVQFGDYLWDLRGGSILTMATGEILQAGSSHQGALHAVRVQSVLDTFALGDVWAYNLQTASGDWATGSGRVAFRNHLGPGNALLPRMMLRTQHMDAYAGNGAIAGPGTWEDQGFDGPADGIGLDFSVHSDEGNAATSRREVPWEQLVSADATVFRTTGASSLKMERNAAYTGNYLELRVFLPVLPGKVVLNEFWYGKPESKPARTHGPFTSGIPAAGDTIYVNTSAGRSIVTIEDKHAQWIGGSGPRPGWTVTLASVTGNPGGVANAIWNATHTVVERLGPFLFTVDLGAGNEAASTASNAGGSAIDATYSQTSVLIFVRQFWTRRSWFDSVGRPVVTQSQYQGEKNIEVTLAAQDWKRWDYGTWYAEPAIASTPTERVGRGRAPDWATHYMLVLNWQNIVEADPAAPPALHLTDFYANVI